MAVHSLDPRLHNDVVQMPSPNLTSNATQSNTKVGQDETCGHSPGSTKSSLQELYASYLLNSSTGIPVSDFPFYCQKFGFQANTQSRVLIDPDVPPMTK